MYKSHPRLFLPATNKPYLFLSFLYLVKDRIHHTVESHRDWWDVVGFILHVFHGHLWPISGLLCVSRSTFASFTAFNHSRKIDRMGANKDLKERAGQVNKWVGGGDRWWMEMWVWSFKEKCGMFTIRNQFRHFKFGLFKCSCIFEKSGQNRKCGYLKL